MTGIGGYRPRRIVPNSEIVERIDSSDEWIRERSGIIERRWAGDGESVIDMSLFAARPALEMAGIEGSDLDAIIVATVSWPYQTPGAAPLVAKAFGSTAMALRHLRRLRRLLPRHRARQRPGAWRNGRARPRDRRRAALRLHQP